MRLRLCILVGLYAALAVAFLPPSASAQETTPLQVEADTVVYDQAQQRVEASGNVRLRYGGIRLAADEAVFDLRTEILTARGRVVLIDAAGRELRGVELIYDARLQQADIRQAETIVNRVYMRGARITATRERILASDAMLTTCDPQRPAVRVTAASIEVIPGEQIIARRAALWIGGVRVLVLPTYVISLRSSEETAASFPRLGYNGTDGFWVDYTYGYRVGGLTGRLQGKYGTKSAWSFRNDLTHETPGYAAGFTVGRNQDPDFKIYDQAEVTLSLSPIRAGRALSVSPSAGFGWFSEPATGVQTTRATAGLAVTTDTVRLGPSTTFGMASTYLHAWFGTGAQQGIVRGNADLRHELSPRTRLGMTYEVLEVLGTSPFSFNAIDPADLHNRITASVTQSGLHLGRLDAEVSAGAGYSFRDRSPIYIAGFAIRDGDRFSTSVRGIYTVNIPELKLSVDGGVRIGNGTRLSVQALYNTRTTVFEELDYTISARFCDCLDATLRYRQVSREIWFEIGLTGFPDTRLQFGFPTP